MLTSFACAGTLPAKVQSITHIKALGLSVMGEIKAVIRYEIKRLG